jgi:hypothetical protein
VCLAAKDVDHLTKLRAFMGATYPIRHTDSVTSFNPNSKFVWFSPRSQHIVDLLRSRGIVPKRIRTPPIELSSSRHFWRGAVDGDGNLGVGLYDGKYLYPHIGLAGQMPLLGTFRAFLIANDLPALNPHKSDKSNVPRISTSGSTAAAIIDCLYKDAAVALDRKMERADRIMRGIIEHTRYDEGPSSVEVDDIVLRDAEQEE